MIARRAFLALALAPFDMAVSATPTMAVVLRGRLDATSDEADEGQFTLTATNLDAPLILETAPDSYLQQWFAGCNGRDLTIRIEPQ